MAGLCETIINIWILDTSYLKYFLCSKSQNSVSTNFSNFETKLLFMEQGSRDECRKWGPYLVALKWILKRFPFDFHTNHNRDILKISNS